MMAVIYWIKHSVKIESLVYQTEESDVFKAYAASQHYRSRGKFWNDGKREIMIRYINLSLVGLVQGCIAYFANIASRSLIEVSEFVYTVIAYTSFHNQQRLNFVFVLFHLEKI